MADNSAARPATILIWIAVVAVLLIGGYKLLNPHHRSADQKILVEKSK